MSYWALLGGLGAGAGLMYLLDPQSGKRRVKGLRDKAVALAHESEEALGKTSRDLANRTRGLAARTTRALRTDDAADEVIEPRVRAILGRYVSHPHAISVVSEDGAVTLSGPILDDETGPLLSAVSRVRGVCGVVDQLERHETRDGIPALQGGAPRPGQRFELLQENWSPAARLLASATGGCMAAWGAARRDWLGALVGTAGMGLLARGLTNRNLKQLTGVGHGGHLVDVHKTINVDAPRERVFELWTRYENFPRFMSGVREVRDLGDGRSHWVVEGPAGVPVGWDAEITSLVPGHLMSWKSLPGSAVRNAGTIHFEGNENGGTRVTVQLSYEPPAGALGHLAAMLFGADPKSRMDEDLLRVKTFIETGKVPHDAALVGS